MRGGKDKIEMNISLKKLINGRRYVTAIKEKHLK